MAKRAHIEKSVGPWAKQKLDALESYLKAYMQVMQKQRFTLFYIDAFAGAGIVRVRDASTGSGTAPTDFLWDEEFSTEDREQAEEYIAGSPLRALNLPRRFHHYRFVDIDPKRVEDLQQLAAPYTDCDLKVLTGEANQKVQYIASKFTKSDWRGVAFLDPYGPHLHWETLEALAGTGKFDVIVNFPLGMAINRLIKRDGEIPENWASQLDKCFGCPEWREVAFGKSGDLFGERSFKHDDAAERLLDLYVGRLKDIFTSVAAPSLVTNTKGAPLYFLIWASSNARGLAIAEHILRLGKKISLPRSSR